jgi:hypothetical protein
LIVGTVLVVPASAIFVAARFTVHLETANERMPGKVPRGSFVVAPEEERAGSLGAVHSRPVQWRNSSSVKVMALP